MRQTTSNLDSSRKKQVQRWSHSIPILNFVVSILPPQSLVFSAANTQWNRLEMYPVDPHHCKQSLLHFVRHTCSRYRPFYFVICELQPCLTSKQSMWWLVFFLLHCRRQPPVLWACSRSRNNATRKMSFLFSYSLLSLLFSSTLVAFFFIPISTPLLDCLIFSIMAYPQIIDMTFTI